MNFLYRSEWASIYKTEPQMWSREKHGCPSTFGQELRSKSLTNISWRQKNQSKTWKNGFFVYYFKNMRQAFWRVSIANCAWECFYISATSSKLAFSSSSRTSQTVCQRSAALRRLIAAKENLSPCLYLPVFFQDSPARRRGKQIIFIDTDLPTDSEEWQNTTPIPTCLEILMPQFL